MMKLLHTSDWHLGRTLAQYSLLDDQSHFLDQMIRFAVDNQVDAVLIAGDLYHRAVPGAAAVELLDGALSRLVTGHGIPVLAIAGNHDSPERLQFCSRLLRGAGLYIEGAVSVPLPSVTLGSGAEAVAYTLLPYFTPAQVRRVLDDESIVTFNDAFSALMRANLPHIDSGKINVLLAHGFFSRLSGHGTDDPVFSASELSVGALDIMDISPAAGIFDYIALGHLHAPQCAGADHIRYAGSPLKYSLSEHRQHKSVTLVELAGKGDVRASQHAFPPLRDLRLIEGTFDALLNVQNQNGANVLDYIHANIVSDDAVLYAMQKLRGVFPNIIGLSFLSPQQNYHETARAAEVAGRSVEELFGEFYENVTGSALSAQRAQVLHTLSLDLKEGAV